MQDRSDQDLLREFVGRGSEEAFSELARRHASLVFGTAKRKVGEASWAEEVSQGVFIALARKAPFLCHRENLSGWLHRTALLEAKEFLRGELRRKRREESAMNFQEEQRTSELAADIDDALMEISEKDRQPLLLRFFEGKSLKEVAADLAIKEDAAQKRVAKSLGLLERVLKRRGKDVGAGALGAMLAGVAEAAPAHLAGSLAQGALAAGGSGLWWVFFGKFMALTKTKMAAVCLLALGVPLLMQTHRLQAARGERQILRKELVAAWEGAVLRVERIQGREVVLKELEADRRLIQEQVVERRPAAQRGRRSEASLYRWSEDSDYVRLPKSILEDVKLARITFTNDQTGLPARADPFDLKGNFSPALVEALSLSEEQVAALTRALEYYKGQFEWLAKQNTYLTNAMPPGIGFHAMDGKLYTFVTKAFPESGEILRKQFMTEWEGIVGVEKAQALLQQGRFEIERGFLDFGKGERWVAAGLAHNGLVTLGKSWPKGGVSTGGNVNTISREELPEEFKQFFPVEARKHE